MEKPAILFEDNHVVVAVKPPNLLTQGDDTGDANLLDQIKEYVKEKYNKPGEAYIGLVHRMDRPVGGLLCFARTSKAASRLSEQVRVHELNRQYVCIVEGEAPDQFTYVDYLAKDTENNKVTVVPAYRKLETGAKEAILHGRTIARRDGLSLVAIQLETGRAHQIRVQMQHAGFPLWGDNRYGNGRRGQQIALWGFRLSFAHPVSKEQMLFIAPTPEEKPWLYFERELKGLESIWPQIKPAVAQE
ncbi:MAG: RluA family pseudouridine synthase [Clostridia bacterium]|nr:RluA family pseudouridine synthase [Clostridiales bacterium]MBQ2976390.1 RluA family pseudouridine synthase [Clostridia bacterium]MBQ6803353.1 RluA family pseudouridine synthase [Clostridia bacterium]MDD6683395.1 RluA family pseudouridine synthase [Clostridiales bacterium]